MAICFDCETFCCGWRRYVNVVESSDLMQNYWNHECSKAKTQDGSAVLIQNAYRNYRKRPVSLAKQVWETVKNDNTSKEKKFLHMPGREYRCTVNFGYMSATFMVNIMFQKII
jgi:hypothetical protein